ncbi:hypothetical protein PENCOP_c015G07539 [Penicillium coprophilum]|uniref:Uncharacterized protein n=1 Tax=Penicillium coprophilum TaxID=36646 RepID=A0A1V6U8P0_9EURO|nr:hypothetical protein PENCOP_c015G07539 [Penicillium coprophilum]
MPLIISFVSVLVLSVAVWASAQKEDLSVPIPARVVFLLLLYKFGATTISICHQLALPCFSRYVMDDCIEKDDADEISRRLFRRPVAAPPHNPDGSAIELGDLLPLPAPGSTPDLLDSPVPGPMSPTILPDPPLPPLPTDTFSRH